MELMSLEETAKQYPVFTVAALRWQLHRRSTSGLSKAIVKVGRRIYVDSTAFEAWLETKRELIIV